MQTIHLPRKKVKKFILEGQELTLSIDSISINHFQRANKKGFLKLLDEIEKSQVNGNLPLYQMLQLLGSCTHLNGQPVGVKFFKDYDEVAIARLIVPMLFELFEGNLPKPNNKHEKK